MGSRQCVLTACTLTFITSQSEEGPYMACTSFICIARKSLAFLLSLDAHSYQKNSSLSYGEGPVLKARHQMAMPVVQGLNGRHHLRMKLCHLLVAWTIALGNCNNTLLSACRLGMPLQEGRLPSGVRGCWLLLPTCHRGGSWLNP